MKNVWNRIDTRVIAGAFGFASALVVSSSASAHVGVDSTSGFAVGFLHPLSGFDHLLAMVAVGVLGSRLGGRALWLVPACFIVMMGIGAALGHAGIGMQGVEFGIAASLVVLGGLLVLRTSLPAALVMAIVGSFAIFHGHAHGTEMPATVAGLTYGSGFVAATALLHAAGIALGIGLMKLMDGRLADITRLCGGFVALAGMGLITGAL
jgi:urease accessory protein